MKRRLTDKLFSDLVRKRDSWTCQVCGKVYPPPTQALHAAHFWGRRKESVRFDLDNADALCFFHHQNFEQHPEEHRAWKLKQLGQDRFDALTVRANTPKKRDDVMTKIILKQMLKEL